MSFRGFSLSGRWPAKTIGIVVFLACWLLGTVLAGPLTCRDGYPSASIGRPGACSHHGGVDRRTGFWVFAISALFGFGAWRFGAKRNEHLEGRDGLAEHFRWKQEHLSRASELPAVGSTQGPPAAQAPLSDGKRCPVCRAPMRSVVSDEGALRGTVHWRCIEYPACSGIELIAGFTEPDISAKRKGRRR